MTARFLLVAAIAILIAAPVQAQDPDSFDDLRRELLALADRLDKLEAENERLKARNEELENIMVPAGEKAEVQSRPADQH